MYMYLLKISCTSYVCICLFDGGWPNSAVIIIETIVHVHYTDIIYDVIEKVHVY